MTARKLSLTFDVYSPRWGHMDEYRILLTPGDMCISQGNFSATCKLGENGDPEWSGYNDYSGNPLMEIFSNDTIYAPAIVPFALEWAWQQWRDGAVSDEILEAGLRELFAWINQTATSTPRTDLWQGAF